MLATLTAALLALQVPNTLSPEETRAGWKLLFDGKTTKGWHNFKSKDIRPGWKVVDGTLACVDPNNAGDIVTDGKYDWFELTLEYKLAPHGNSGIMFHVADDGEYTWHSGPEVQLYDHWASPGVQISGYLYELYDSKQDAQKPAGQWNSLRILISPEKCETVLNGVKYYEFVLGSEDFKSRVAKSKFSKFPNFGKLGKGTIAIQGDHGEVAFKNVKIREIKKG
jgi:hypothetical protein